jgi:lambda family phage tail tape measure protein
MVESSEIEALDEQLDALETSIAATTAVSAAFSEGLNTMQADLAITEVGLKSASKSMSNQLGGAFSDVIFEGEKLSDSLRNMAQSMLQASLNSAIKPVTDGIASTITGGLDGLLGGLLGFQDGGAFASGRVSAFAKGGVVSGATTFPMRGGMGLMGEAGPEAIMPLSRGADGALGVKAAGGGQSVTVNMNVSTPDAASFSRSRSQIAAGINRAISRGQRNF